MTDDFSRFPAWLGLAQGAALYALYKTYQSSAWPPDQGALFNALLMLALLLPFVVYWSQGVLARTAARRLWIAASLTLAGLGAWQGLAAFPVEGAARPPLVSVPAVLGLAMIAFMVVPLTSGWTRGCSGAVLGAWHYPRLFEVAWRNAVITAQAGAVTGLLWVVLTLGAQMFHLIGVEWPKDTIARSWFAIPVTTLSIAFGLRTALRREAFTTMLRNHWLALIVWLLPLASLIGAAFALTSLAGVERLFERGLSAFFLLWFAAFWIKFYNAAYQDGSGEPALHPLLRRGTALASLALVAVVGMAAWALTLRILQYGLTPDRIWGALALVVGLIYAVGYAVSLRRPAGPWMAGIASANVLAALAMCAGIALLLSPALDVDRLATASQMARLETGRTAPDDFDVHALTRQGRAGHDALRALQQRRGADGKPDALALRAEDAHAARGRYGSGFGENWDDPVAKARFDAARIEMHPAGAALPDALTTLLAQEIAAWTPWQGEMSCFSARAAKMRCALLRVDLDRDGRDEAVVWLRQDDAYPRVYGETPEGWVHLGMLRPESGASDSARARLGTGDYAVESRRWDVLRLGKARYQVVEAADADSDSVPAQQ